MKHEIGVIVNLPTTAEGMAQLEKAMCAFNSKLVSCVLRKVDAPVSAKLEYVKSLNGVAPWANAES